MPPENTYLFDPESAEEMVRLIYQDACFTQGMGGFFAERANDFSGIERVLDIGCGPGEWVRDLAEAHPQIQVVGIDVSRRMIEYADAQKALRGLDNVQFRVMDATKPLDFPDGSFDLVNARYLSGFLSAPLWPQVVNDFWRLLRPGGYLRHTESEFFGTSNSRPLETLAGLLTAALKQVGHSLAPEARSNGLVLGIAPLMRQVGFQDVNVLAHLIEYSKGTQPHPIITKDWEIGYRLAFDIMLKTGVADNITMLETLHENMLEDFQQEEFRANHDLITTYGHKPLDK
jgi:SAM-dependent methyltransferase